PRALRRSASNAAVKINSLSFSRGVNSIRKPFACVFELTYSRYAAAVLASAHTTAAEFPTASRNNYAPAPRCRPGNVPPEYLAGRTLHKHRNGDSPHAS